MLTDRRGLGSLSLSPPDAAAAAACRRCIRFLVHNRFLAQLGQQPLVFPESALAGGGASLADLLPPPEDLLLEEEEEGDEELGEAEVGMGVEVAEAKEEQPAGQQGGQQAGQQQQQQEEEYIELGEEQGCMEVEMQQGGAVLAQEAAQQGGAPAPNEQAGDAAEAAGAGAGDALAQEQAQLAPVQQAAAVMVS